MNDASQPQNGGVGKPKRAPAGSRGPEQAYPDPPRSWTRAGILLGGWVAAWTGVLFFGMGLQAVAQAQDEERLPLGGQAVSRQLFHEVFLERDLDAAGDYLCDTYSGISLENITQNYLDWEDANGRAGVTIRVNEVSPQEFEVTIDYGPNDNLVIEGFTVITQAHDGDDCVDGITEREIEDTPSPTPDDSTTEPELTGQDAIKGYFDQIYQNQDVEAAESYQCEEYSGVSTSELLEIYSSHEHEGAGSTQYSLGIRATDSVAGQSDDFSVLVSLDDEEHPFVVVVDATTPTRCVTSVTAA